MLDKKTTQAILSDEAYMACSCHVEDCPFRGKCRECVALHRYCGKLPTCLEKTEDS